MLLSSFYDCCNLIKKQGCTSLQTDSFIIATPIPKKWGNSFFDLQAVENNVYTSCSKSTCLEHSTGEQVKWKQVMVSLGQLPKQNKTKQNKTKNN